MKALLFLWGESYRSGSIGQTRNRGESDYMRRQILASKSHIRLIESLQAKGSSVDVIIDSYRLNQKDDDSLCGFYTNKTHLLYSRFHPQMFPSEMHFFISMFEKAKEYLDRYDILLFIRIDLYLKKYCIENFSLDSNKILFGHIDSNIDVLSYNQTQRTGFNIGQVIMTIPKCLFQVISKDILARAGHPHWFRNILILEDIPSEKIGFLINSPFVCSTCSGWNPLYIQVGRIYNRSYHKNEPPYRVVEYWFDSENSQFIHDTSKTIERWKDEIDKDSLEENLETLQENTFEECF